MICRLLLVVRTNNHARYFATFCYTSSVILVKILFGRPVDKFGSGTYTTIGLIIAWCAYYFLNLYLSSGLNTDFCPVAHNLGSETKKSYGNSMLMGDCTCFEGYRELQLTNRSFDHCMFKASASAEACRLTYVSPNRWSKIRVRP